MSSVRAEYRREDLVLVPVEDSNRGPGFSIPNASRLVVGGRDNSGTIGAEHTRPDPIRVSVERSDLPPFQLTDSGRFVHHVDHVTEVARESALTVVSVDDAVLRYEYGTAVDGLVAVLKAPVAWAFSPVAVLLPPVA